METIERFMNINPDTELIARKNQEYNNCRKALDDICFSLQIDTFSLNFDIFLYIIINFKLNNIFFIP